jgi:hypothetical protein
MAGVQSMDANKKNYYEVNGPSINAYTPYREGDVEETASRERMFSGEPPGTRTQGPRLKAPPRMRKINPMTLLNPLMSDKHVQRVTVCVSYIGHPNSLRYGVPAT